MKDRDLPNHKSDASLLARGVAASRFAAGLPFKLIGRAIVRTIQVVFALFVVVLHPQLKWLFNVIAESSLVRNYIRPSLQTLAATVYEPYFAYLRELPPYWATVSIAVPLAILEPAKTVATILIATRPRMGILLWLALQGVSFVLIDRTWAAVRPQSRKVWLVSRIHAWAWLNVEYGKHWIRTSSIYLTLLRWKERARRLLRVSMARLSRRGRKPRNGEAWRG